jgi:PKD-like domain
MKKIILTFFLFTGILSGISAQNTRYICYDEAGNRTNRGSISCTILPTCPEPLAITGKIDVCQDGIYTYTVPTTPQATYTWLITGGTIISGQNTNKVQVKWNTGIGKVEISLAK